MLQVIKDMRTIFTEPLIILNTGVLAISFTNVEMILKIVLLIITIFLSLLKLKERLQK